MIQSETLELLEWSRLCQHLATFAATKLGAIAARRLKIPARQADTLTLLAQTQEVYSLESRLPSGLRFDGIDDIGEAIERAALQGILSGAELLAIAKTLSGARTLRRTIDNQDEIPVLSVLVSELRTYPEIEQEIYRCINDDGKVSERASPKLAEIRAKQKQLRDRIYDLLQRLMQRQANAIQEQLITQRDGRYVVPVKAPQKDAVPGIVHDTSMSGATLYVEPNSTIQFNNQLRQLQRQEQVEEEAVRRVLTEQVAAVQDDLERLLVICTTLDLATARARYSLWLEANPPRFINYVARENVSPEVVTLRQLRHPLLVWQQRHEQGRSVIPIDLFIQPQIKVVAITGPNTGGKTVTLKTFGLAILMAKVGLFIPAREPVELPWFDQVLADIGDEQSLEQSLSTFSGHIRRISRILNALTVDEDSTQSENSDLKLVSNSLVLLDEVGAGTDPTEGSALAIALLKYLADHAALTIATTHFGELKALKYEDDRFENASVEFDDVSLSPTYRLLWGIPGRSNALTIARRLGLKEDIIQSAQEQVGGASEDVNQVIAGLESQRRRQETKAQEAAKILESAEKLYRQVSDKAANLQERERSLQQAQEKAVQDAIVEAKSEIAKVIRQLQKGNVTAQDAQQATDALNRIAEKQLPSRQPAKPKPGFRPQVGDKVRIPRLGQTAEVISVSDDEELVVRFGLMKMTVPLQDVESLTGEKPAKREERKSDDRKSEEKTPPPPTPAIRTSRNTIDIRGNRVADAEILLDRAISEVGGAIWIIHGHGTGKLRQGVHAFLQQHPRIQRFELAPPEDGGSGVTIAYPI
ncbi:endonuclease MutS2 [Phormidesmis priestleyi ULC007]|uniref:Endonuclease MutS2 n=1 Tax=Phormidesmis priestleyi ULC007 TaxID=1920490 RepID=A0A2T1DE92_9CYAN|nr:endonuclease MutS2 [Phormidesmis priestleyi]PSB18830.1 endonuclease MutS2 [Phormidesmis priestleyi ULC007]PZO51031.1 MAG: endonuclease MutS2 [Phormidesmis priestleyi]